MADTNKLSAVEKATPIAGVVLSVLSLFAQNAPSWVQYAGVGIGLLLVMAWLFSRASWLGQAIKFRLFRSKLPKEQALRLSVLLDDINNYMSCSYTLSPFYVWKNAANEHHRLFQMNYSYYYAIHCWLDDLRARLDDPRLDILLLVGSLSKAISETTKLGGFVGNSLSELLGRAELTEDEKKRISREWDSARGHFNQWIDKWQILFKEMNKSTNCGCVEYFRPLETIY